MRVEGNSRIIKNDWVPKPKAHTVHEIDYCTGLLDWTNTCLAYQWQKAGYSMSSSVNDYKSCRNMNNLKNRQSYPHEATCTEPETIHGVGCLNFVAILLNFWAALFMRMPPSSTQWEAISHSQNVYCIFLDSPHSDWLMTSSKVVCGNVFCLSLGCKLLKQDSDSSPLSSLHCLVHSRTQQCSWMS